MRLSYPGLWAMMPLLLHAQASEPRFERDIIPIITVYCVKCHGKTSPQLGLDLRTAASAMRGSHNGPVVVRGSTEKSLLWEKISTKAMPPPAFDEKLPEQHIETIRRWIKAGAPADRPEDPKSAEHLAQVKDFASRIQPLFNASCVGCHGERKPAAGLDLRSFESLLKGSVNGAVVMDGLSNKSVLVRKLMSGAMPPKGTAPPLTTTEIAAIGQWIDRGHLVEGEESRSPDRAFTSAEAPEISEKDRQFWAFRKPVATVPPKPKNAKRVRTPVDAFLLAKLEAKGLEFSPDAPPYTLLRRAYMDLTGLPPTPEEIQEFAQDTKPGAYERLVDRLLASPRYGERWGRHWLDAAGYVDTSDKDFDIRKPELAPGMWRYRDYVIRATNDDKGWDRFLTEQIAGDELVDWRSAKKFTPEIVDLLTATGYMRNVLDITDSDILNLPVERYEALFKLVEKVSASTMGLTVACARCHTHKFDPIPQRDYYRFLALFTPAYNPSKWLQPKNRVLYTVSEQEQEEIRKHNAEIDRPVNALKQQLGALREPYEKRIFEEKLKMLPENLREDVRSAIATPADKRDVVQKYLAGKFGATLTAGSDELAKAFNAADRAAVADLQSRIDRLESYRRNLEPIQALWDVGAPPSIRLLQRGSAESPGPKVQPGFLTVLSDAGQSTTTPYPGASGKTNGLRLAFAKWLTARDHPLTSRVIVNRIWQHHFGTGIVATPDNFGKNGAPPTHPELLDWLAVNFMENGWSAKRVHKLIMISTAYRQSSRQDDSRSATARRTDPENQLLWRMNLRRLEAETLRDSVLSVAGALDPAMGGSPVMLDIRPDGLITVPGKLDSDGKSRRSVYLLTRRTYPLNFLGVFDAPVIDAYCARRVPSATPLQSLTLMNDQFILDAAVRLASLTQSAAAVEQIKRLWLRTLSRTPSQEEVNMAQEHVTRQEQLYGNANVPRADASARAWASLAHMLLASNEFLYSE